MRTGEYQYTFLRQSRFVDFRIPGAGVGCRYITMVYVKLGERFFGTRARKGAIRSKVFAQVVLQQGPSILLAVSIHVGRLVLARKWSVWNRDNHATDTSGRSLEAAHIQYAAAYERPVDFIVGTYTSLYAVPACRRRTYCSGRLAVSWYRVPYGRYWDFGDRKGEIEIIKALRRGYDQFFKEYVFRTCRTVFSYRLRKCVPPPARMRRSVRPGNSSPRRRVSGQFHGQSGGAGYDPG